MISYQWANYLLSIIMTIEELKTITEARLNSASLLIEKKDWFFAAYTMAMALECALKAAICKTLNLNSYPENIKNQKIVNFFWTHEFEQLRILAGLNATFSPNTGITEVVQNWGNFTIEFAGDWSKIRYDYERQRQFDRTKVERLYNMLNHTENGIITKIKEIW